MLFLLFWFYLTILRYLFIFSFLTLRRISFSSDLSIRGSGCSWAWAKRFRSQPIRLISFENFIATWLFILLFCISLLWCETYIAFPNTLRNVTCNACSCVRLPIFARVCRYAVCTNSYKWIWWTIFLLNIWCYYRFSCLIVDDVFCLIVIFKLQICLAYLYLRITIILWYPFNIRLINKSFLWMHLFQFQRLILSFWFIIV